MRWSSCGSKAMIRKFPERGSISSLPSNYSDDRIARDALSSVRSGVLDLTGVRKTLSPSDAPDGTTETQSRVRFAVANSG